VPRRRGAESLSRERLIEAALELVDEQGLAALTMRRLGAALGVDPMAIYYHVPGERALLKALVERVYETFALEGGAGGERGEGGEAPWPERLRRWARAYRALALRHPNLVLEVVGDPEAVALAARHTDRSLQAAVRASGLPPGDVAAGTALTVDYVNGFVLGEVAIPGGAEGAFERGLDIIVAGLERLAEEASTRP
jgi:AcrR family transcriptional regulator